MMAAPPAPPPSGGGDDGGAAPAVVAPAYVPGPTATPNAEGIIYAEVQAGDSKWALAARAGLTIDEILEMNDMSAGDVLRPGDLLIVGSGDPPSAEPAPKETEADAEEAEAGAEEATAEEAEAAPESQPEARPPQIAWPDQLLRQRWKRTHPPQSGRRSSGLLALHRS